MSILKTMAKKQNNGIGAYLKYAISEIILVVIGILIAVSINNWNETKKNKRDLNTIFTTIKEELKKDVATIDNITDYYKKRAPIYEAILNRKITAEQYIQKRMNAFILIGFPEFAAHTSGYEQLKNYRNRTDSEADSLRNTILSFYTVRLRELSVDDAARTINFENDFTYMKENFDWWGAYLYEKKVDGFLDYALNDTDYYNRVATSRFLNYDVFLVETFLYKAQALEVIETIEKHLKNTNLAEG